MWLHTPRSEGCCQQGHLRQCALWARAAFSRLYKFLARLTDSEPVSCQEGVRDGLTCCQVDGANMIQHGLSIRPTWVAALADRVQWANGQWSTWLWGGAGPGLLSTSPSRVRSRCHATDWGHGPLFSGGLRGACRQTGGLCSRPKASSGDDFLGRFLGGTSWWDASHTGCEVSNLSVSHRHKWA